MVRARIGGTTTGAVLESMILPALTRGGYIYQRQALVGVRPTGRRHKVDVVAMKDGRAVLVSLKGQQVSGTAEQKVPFEVMCLIDALANEDYHDAYLVLGGSGWTTRDFYTSGGLAPYMPDADRVNIVTLETFVAKANRGAL